MSKVIFLLGAGASTHLEFPTGAELQRRILKDHRHSEETRELLHAQFDSNKVEEFYTRLHDIDVDSIDEFLAVQVDEELQSIGRFLIANCLGKAEHHSLSVATSVSANWYKIFKRYLFTRPQLVDASKFSFITFNYDRSFEHYLSRGLLADPRFGTKQVTDFLGPKNLLHMHGTLGEIVETSVAERLEYGAVGPLTGRDSSGGVLRFDKKRVPERLQLLAKASSALFLTHAEIRREKEVRAIMADATHLIILGFGFHRSNCEKVLIHEFVSDSRAIVATARDLSPAAQIYTAKLKNYQSHQVSAHELFTNQLLRTFDEIFSISVS